MRGKEGEERDERKRVERENEGLNYQHFTCVSEYW